MIDRYICIHGHFYQPPRENPWLGVIEVQDSAAPFHDWNERVTAECYRPNSRARILDHEGWIDRIVNNYARMSFNFGPTLLSWMESFAPDVYAAVLRADRDSAARFGGHGSAIAQPYGHLIMPLANSRDKRTQVLWGIADFRHRFGRDPEGMWLPETAVDLETLDIMAEAGIRFTVLAPHQAARTRIIGESGWQDAREDTLDTRHPYRVRLPSGRALSVFFYDAAIARGVAFEGLLESGEKLASRILDAFDEDSEHQVVNVATDGETYGHHHRFGEMALAYALETFERAADVTLTNYAHYLDMFPPQHEAELIENTSWSCAHGVERWRSDCGDSNGGKQGWTQAWRRPLRQALDWLRDELVPQYEAAAGRLLQDPWAARDDYLSLLLDRSEERIDAFLARHAARSLDHLEKTRALKLLELQNQAMRMFTSCGWFFNDISGIETVQVLAYAGRAAQLAQQLFGDHLEARLLEKLAEAKSNDPAQGDGAQIYRRYVDPAKVDLWRAFAHYAVSSLFENYGFRTRMFEYVVERHDFDLEEAGPAKLAVGLARIESLITLEDLLVSFGVVHLGDQNIAGGMRAFQGTHEYNDMVHELRQTFLRGELTDVVHSLDRLFPGRPFSLRSLFRDEQRKIVRQILQPAMDEAEAIYRSFYQEHLPLFRFLAHIQFALPNRFHAAADIALNIEMRRALQQDDLRPERVADIATQAALAGIEIDREAVQQELTQTLDRLVQRFLAQPGDPKGIRRLVTAVQLVHSLSPGIDLSNLQNAVYDIGRTPYYDLGVEAALLIEQLAEAVRVRIPRPGLAPAPV